MISVLKFPFFPIVPNFGEDWGKQAQRKAPILLCWGPGGKRGFPYGAKATRKERNTQIKVTLQQDYK